MRPQNGPVAGEVIKVVHDDCNEEIEHQEGTDDEEANEVDIGKVASAALLFSRIVRLKNKKSRLILRRSIVLLTASSHFVSGELMQESIISCQASPVADLKRISSDQKKVWKLLAS